MGDHPLHKVAVTVVDKMLHFFVEGALEAAKWSRVGIGFAGLHVRQVRRQNELGLYQ